MNSNFNFSNFNFSNENNSIFQNQQEHSQNVTRDMNITQSKSDWKKSMSDRLMRRIIKQRENRVDQIRMNKEEILNDIRYDEMIVDSFEGDYQMLSEYFDRILILFENDKIDPGQYLIETHDDSNISVCPFCSYPVIITSLRVMCLNLCFEYNVQPNTFNLDFNLDNFVDILNQTYKQHNNCLLKSQYGIELLQFDDGINLVCGKCFSENKF